MNTYDKMKQNFEEIVRNSVNSHEMPYETGAWETFQKNAIPTSPFYAINLFIAIAIFAVLGTATAYVVNQEKSIFESEKQISSIDKVVVENAKTIENKSLNKTPQTETEEIKDKTETAPITKNSDKPEKHISVVPNSTEERKNDLGQESQTERPYSVTQRAENQETETIKPENAKASFFLPKTICSGETVYLTSEENKISHTYEWRIDNELTLKGSIQKFIAKSAGLKSVSLVILNENGNILAEETQSIEVKNSPEISMEVQHDEFSIKNNYDFEVTHSSNATHSWDLGDGTKSNQRNFSHSYTKAGIYNVVCKSKTEFGCTKSVSQQIEIPGIYNFRKDYGFSPNGDNMNDLFIPVELSSLNVKFSMNIYARNGQLIYTTNSFQNPWNGLLPDGTRCPFGSYVWVVTLTNEFGNKEVYKGTITNVSN